MKYFLPNRNVGSNEKIFPVICRHKEIMNTVHTRVHCNACRWSVRKYARGLESFYFTNTFFRFKAVSFLLLSLLKGDVFILST